MAEVLAQLAGFEVPRRPGKRSVLPARVRGYRREWLDELTLSGEVAWGRLWGSAASHAPHARRCVLVPREELDAWLRAVARSRRRRRCR